MADPYTNYIRCYDRIRREYLLHPQFIVAFDFDDTVYDTHKRGWEYTDVIETLKQAKEVLGAYCICWSASLPERYPKMQKHFEEMGIPCDAINENHPNIAYRGPKIYANLYLDDRSGLATSLLMLQDLIKEFPRGKQDV